jgi:hypothetical protein
LVQYSFLQAGQVVFLSQSRFGGAARIMSRNLEVHAHVFFS